MISCMMFAFCNILAVPVFAFENELPTLFTLKATFSTQALFFVSTLFCLPEVKSDF